MDGSKILKLLKRTDKWYLGAGNRLLWAPPFPLYLERPGFWDEASYYNIAVRPLFTWAILDESGHEMELAARGREWNPAVLLQHYRPKKGREAIALTERRCVLPNNVAVSELTVHNRSKQSRRLSLIAWSAFESSERQGLVESRLADGVLTFARITRRTEFPDFRFGCSFGMAGPGLSAAARTSEGSVPQPLWGLSPFAEDPVSKGFTRDCKADFSQQGIHFVAFRRAVNLAPGRSTRAVGAFAMGSSVLEAESNARVILKQRDPVRLSIMNWSDHFESVPEFHSENEFFEMAYWYRWYGLKLNMVIGREERYGYPFVAEGIAEFRAPISYSAPCHMMENRWMHEPDLARGSLLTFIDNQREDGSFPGYIDIKSERPEMFYHANWGRAVLRLDQVHPSEEFLKNSYEGLKKLASYYDRERDREISGLYDINNHQETGQEYSSRYMAVSGDADRIQWGMAFRLKGVDVTVYVYELKCALAKMAEKLGLSSEAELWMIEAEKIRNAVRDLMWDSKDKMFYDVNPETGSKTRVKSVVSFYPYFTDIAKETHLAGLRRHLFSRKEFWTKVPVPSLSRDDPNFSARPEWKGTRMLCPWNGRVWPMTNSHVADAITSSAIRFRDPQLRHRAAEFVEKFIRMLFFDGDPKRPNSFEHYHPDNGSPSIYRGIDDYQHSWIVDLIIQYVCGIRVEEFSVTVDPFPFGLRRAGIENIQVRGHRLDVAIKGANFTVTVDDRKTIRGSLDHPVSVQI